MNMRLDSRFLAVLALVPLLAGCAGGWRGGSPPAEWGGAAGTGAAPALAAATGAGGAGVTHATSDGAVFVWKGEGGAVHVAGDFNAWSTSADPLAKQPDGSWRLAKKLAAGRYAYKFVLDGTSWKPDPNVAEGVDDGFGAKNSLIVVGGAAGAAAAAPAAATPAVATPAAAKGAAPTETAAGVVFRFSGAANTVHLAGEFNSWSTSADPMTKAADGTYSITKPLPAGRYAYKFVLDGTNWKEDPSAAEAIDDGYGGKNSLVVVGGAAGGAAAPAAQAGTPVTPAPAAPPAAAAAVRALAPGAGPRAPKFTDAGVEFTYAGPAKTGVALCGDFNSWATTSDRMTQGADGTWTIVRKLPAGRYAYKFLVDGSTWKQDDGNTESSDDGFGGKNSIVVVK
jgi:1,4-alpha-glucan branching enzyme